MAGAFDDLIPTKTGPKSAGGGLFDDLIPKTPKRKRTAMGEVSGFMANVNRGLAIGDELAAAGNTAGGVIGAVVKGEPVSPDRIATRFKNELAAQREREDDFTARRPMTAALARGIGMATTAVVPTAPVLASSSVGMATLRGAATGAGVGYGYGLADRGDMRERADSANVGAMTGAVLGGAIGGGGKILENRAVRRAMTEPEIAGDVLRRRAKVDPAPAAERARDIRAAGVDPTGLDVIGERGRRVVRAVGVKSETAGEELVANARTTSAGTKPAVMVSTRALVDEPRTAAGMMDDLVTAREVQAATEYRAPYETPVQIDAQTASALRGDAGRAALRRARQAAAARRNDAQMQEIDSLMASNMEEFPQVSAGTLDRIRIAMGERAKTLGQRGSRDIAGGVRARAADLDTALGGVEGLEPARAAYKAKSQAIDILEGPERLDVFSTDPSDYAAWMAQLSPEARRANQVGIRQEILDTLGGQRASTFGSLDELATSPYVRENLRAALGQDVADGYLANLAARLEQTRNATFVSPNANSRTEVLRNDVAEATKGVIDTGVKVARGDGIGLIQSALDWFTRRGISAKQAEALARATTDPAQLDRLLVALAKRSGPDEARSLLQAVGVEQSAAEQILGRLSLTRAVGIGGAAPRGQPVETGANPAPYPSMTAANRSR